MKENEKIPADIGEMGRRIIATTLVLALTGPTWASDWKLGASITASETYTDNVTLGAAGGSKSDLVTSVTPTITARKDGARLKVDASYSNQNLFYAQDATRNTTNHQLSAHANAELLENEIFLDTSASISQAAISPLAATGVDNINATGNLTSVRSLTVSPYWIHRFGSTATLNARYTISEVGNSNGGLAGSTNSGTNLSLASGSAFGRISWGLNYSEQNADYQDRSDVTFSTTSASLGYLVSTRVKLTGTVGNEKNSYVSSTGAKTGGSFWNVTGSWAPSTRTSLDLGFGHRYYGKSWNMAFKTRGVSSDWTADYSESVTTSNSQASAIIPTAVSLNIQGVGTLSGTFNDPTRIQSNQVFLSKRFGTGFSWKRGKSGISLNAYRSIQEALESGQITGTLNNGAFQSTNTIKQVGFTAGWTWQLTPLISSSVTGGISRSSYPDLSRDDTTTSLQLGLNRKFSPHLTGSVSLRRQMRDSNQNADFTENALSGSVTYTF
jgi:uncharacterized protein (PEP-CTERM system associated)